jgi:apolipoprotein N-acyltransferase
VSATALSRLPLPALAGVRGLLRPVAAALVSAALYGLAFAPLPGAWLLGWGALAPLLAATAAATPFRAAGLGLLFGSAGGLATCWWLPEMLQRYFGFAPLSSWLAAGASFAVFAGLHCAAFAAWVALLARRGRLSPALVALGWVSCEWVRASVGVANPWALSAYSQVDVRPLAQLADLAGPSGIGALLAAGSALLAGIFAPALRPARPLRAAALFAALLVAALGYGSAQLAREHASGPELRVAVIQGGIARPDGGGSGDSRAELERYLALSAEAVAAAAPQLVIWPEGALDFSPFEATQRMLRLRDASRAQDADLILGAPRRAENGRRRNSMVQLRRGRVRGVQDKLELMPFSERSVLGIFGRDAYAPGEEIRLFEVGGLRLGSAICSEAMGPDFPRRLVAAGASLILNPSNDYWFVSPEAARQQLAKARLRAIETRRFVVRATSTGYSALIDPRGDLVAVGGFGGAEWLAGSVHGASGTSVHQRAGAFIGPGALAFCAAASFARRRRRRACPGEHPRQHGAARPRAALKEKSMKPKLLALLALLCAAAPAGAECVPAGLPPACSVDFVQKVRLSGRLLVVQDDQAEDEALVARVATGIVLEVKARGRTTRLVELFDGSEIGHWNAFLEAFLLDTASSIQFTNADESAYNFASDNLEEIGSELREIARAAWPAIDLSGSVALLTSVVRESPKKSVDHAEAGDPLASAASFKVVIRFARLRP